MRAIASIAFLVVLIAVATVGAGTSWKCREVIDGDTLVAESDAGRVVRVNLFGIDAPELDQGRGAEAKAFVEEIALGKAITISDIPSAFTRNRETMRFVDMMLRIAAVVGTLGEMEASQARHCSGRQGFTYGDGDGSVWSEELNEWVDGTYANREEACRALNLDISRGRGAVRDARDEAVASARRFGVKDSTIREVLVYLDLDQL